MTAKQRFLMKVKKTKSCWLWIAGISSSGYGDFRLNGDGTTAHRASFLIFRGEIPSGLIVLHECDNPLCVRPSHLHLGTHADNTHEAMDRGRLARGERLPQAKLTSEKVKLLRDRYAQGGLSNSKLGAVFGVTESTVRRVVRGTSWSHV